MAVQCKGIAHCGDMREEHVPDLSCSMRKIDGVMNVSWATQFIIHAQYKSIQHLNSFVYKLSATTSMVKVLVTEWASALFIVSVFVS